MSVAQAFSANAMVFAVVAIVAAIVIDTDRGHMAKRVALGASSAAVVLFIASAWASVLA